MENFIIFYADKNTNKRAAIKTRRKLEFKRNT